MTETKTGRIKKQGEAWKPPNFWTEEENDSLEQGLKLYGKNMLKLQEHLPNRSKKEIENKYNYKRKHMKDNEAEKSELTEILAKVKPKNEIDQKYWTEEEHLLFEEAIKSHGVDKNHIHKMVSTRTI